jgi:hypothetical protein
MFILLRRFSLLIGRTFGCRSCSHTMMASSWARTNRWYSTHSLWALITIMISSQAIALPYKLSVRLQMASRLFAWLSNCNQT